MRIGDKVFMRIGDKVFMRIGDKIFVRIGDKIFVRISDKLFVRTNWDGWDGCFAIFQTLTRAGGQEHFFFEMHFDTLHRGTQEKRKTSVPPSL